MVLHVYVAFRLRLARYALRQFAASLKSSAEILVLLGTHVLIGLFGVAAFPSMYLASLPAAQALPLLVGHALLMTIPLALLRKRVLPIDVVSWAHRLPIAPRVQLHADALVATLLVGPLALLYTVSGTILLWYGGPWLAPVPGVLGTLFSLLLTLAFSTAMLSLRSRRIAGRLPRQHAAAKAPPYHARRNGPRMLQPLPLLWHRLFWLPFWRADNVVGWQQSILFAAALGSAIPWMQAPQGVARALLALATSALVVLLTDRGDKAVREQIARLRPLMAGWPLAPRALFCWARAASVLPALVVLMVVFAGGAMHGLWEHTAGRVYLAFGCAGQLLLVATSLANARFRVGLVVGEIIFLTAVGSELWP